MIIYGYRTRNRVMGQTEYPCQKCQQNSFHTLVRTRQYFTLFWVLQLFPISKKTTSRCNICGYQTKFDNKKADEMFPAKKAKEEATVTSNARGM